MRFLSRLLLAAALAVAVPSLAQAANSFGDGICETTTTTGTGTVNLGGALTGGYRTFVSQIASGDSVPYTITTGTGGSRKIETGRGTFTDAAPDTLTRAADNSTDGNATLLTLSGTSTVCLGVNKAFFNGNKGDITTSAGFQSWTVNSDSVALSTDTTGNYAAGDAEAGNALTGDSATAFFSTGTLEDARVDGSLEADEVNPTLGTQTQGNFVNDITQGTGIVKSGSAGEGWAPTIAFSFADQGASPALNADECVFTSNATAAGYLVCEGDTADLIESRIAITDPSGSDKTFTIPNADSYPITDKSYGDVTVSASGQTWAVNADSVALTTDTTGNYVGSVADGTGIDGTAAGEGATYTPTLDLTEISSMTWGAGSFTTETYDAGAVDPVFRFSSGGFAIEGGGTGINVNVDDQGSLRLSEEDGNGSNYKAFAAPAAITADTTCTLEDDANFIPDSCVGNGTDDGVAAVADGTGVDGTAGAGGTYTPTLDLTELSTVTWGAGSFTTEVFDAGATDPTFTFGSNSWTVSNAATINFGSATTLSLGNMVFATSGIIKDANSNELIRFPAAVGSAVNDVTISNTATGGEPSYVASGDDTNIGLVFGVKGSPANTTDQDASFRFDAGATDYAYTQFRNTSAGAGGAWITTFADSASPAAADDVGGWGAFGRDSAANYQKYGDIHFKITDPTSTSEDGAIYFAVAVNGTIASAKMIMDGVALYPFANDGLALGASGTAWADLWLAGGGLIEFDGGTTNTFTCTAGDCTIEGNRVFRAGGADVPVLDGGTGASTLTDLIALTTMTTGNYVATVADGTGIDGTASGEGTTYTPTLDLTEIASATWGSGSGVVLTYDAATNDMVETWGAGSLQIATATAATGVVNLDNQVAGLRFSETDANGSNYKGFAPPASITADTTCTFEDDANFIPDSCVGDGVDAGADGLGPDGNKGDVTVGGTGTTLTVNADSVALTTDTTGNYVGTVADGTGIDGTASGEGTTYTPTLDLTELSSVTWGAGAFTTMTFDAGAVDPVWNYGTQAEVQLDMAGGAAATFRVKNTEGGATGPGIEIYHDSASPAASDIISMLSFYGRDSAANKQRYGLMEMVLDDPTSTSEDSTLFWEVITAGTNNLELKLDGAALAPTSSNGLDLGKSTLPFQHAWLTDIELGAASDTTVARTAAGRLTVEGVELLRPAVQSDQETSTSNILGVTPGTQQYHPSAAKMWAYVTYSGGTPTLTANYNVTSITDTGTGDLLITIATDFSSANYASFATCMYPGDPTTPRSVSIKDGTLAAGSFSLLIEGNNGGQIDPTSCTALAFGDQ